MGAFDVETVSVDGGVTALGSAGSFTVVVDRAREAGGGGKGFNGGQLLNLAVAACISNDLYREAGARGVALRRVAVTVRSDYAGTPAVSTPIAYDVAVEGEATEAERVTSAREEPTDGRCARRRPVGRFDGPTGSPGGWREMTGGIEMGAPAWRPADPPAPALAPAPFPTVVGSVTSPSG